MRHRNVHHYYSYYLLQSPGDRKRKGKGERAGAGLACRVHEKERGREIGWGQGLLEGSTRRRERGPGFT